MVVRKKIIIGSSSFSDRSLERLKKITKNKYILVKNTLGRNLSYTELMKLCTDKYVIASIAGLEKYDKKILEKSNLKIISRVGSGISNIDLDSAKKNGIKVFSTPLAPVESVAELTISMMIQLLRNTYETNYNLRNNNWSRSIGDLLRDKKILLIGFGRIGKKVFKLLNVFNNKPIIYDINKNLKYKNYFVSLKKGLMEADIVSIHVSSNREIIGEKEFKILKKNIIILNSSRGEVINEKAFIKNIKLNRIKGAWIDVFQQEPYSGLLNKIHPNIITTPHISSHTTNARFLMENEAIENLINNMVI